MSSEPLQFKTNLIRRLHCAEGHLRGIQGMVECRADCESLIRQVLAVQGALREINRLILKQHLDLCVRNQMQSPDIAARESDLAELVSLYQLLGGKEFV